MSQPPTYVPPPEQTPAPKRSNTVLWVVLILGVGAMCVGLVILAAILFPVFSQARLSAQRTACLSNVKQASLSLLMYASDNNDRFPLAREWMDRGISYSRSEESYKCPIVAASNPSGFGFGMNAQLGNLSMIGLSDPHELVLLFESGRVDRNFSGGMGDVVRPGRHGAGSKGSNFGFADGGCRYIVDGSSPGRWVAKVSASR
jgi:hypothetical protein